MFSTRDKNGNMQKKGVHMLNVWMLLNRKFNIRPTALSSKDRDAKLQCRIHCDHLLMSSVRTGWVAAFQTPDDSMLNTVDSRMFPTRANSLAPDGQTSLTRWSKWNTSKQLCHPVKVLTSRLTCLIQAESFPFLHCVSCRHTTEASSARHCEQHQAWPQVLTL